MISKMSGWKMTRDAKMFGDTYTIYAQIRKEQTSQGYKKLEPKPKFMME